MPPIPPTKPPVEDVEDSYSFSASPSVSPATSRPLFGGSSTGTGGGGRRGGSIVGGGLDNIAGHSTPTTSRPLFGRGDDNSASAFGHSSFGSAGHSSFGSAYSASHARALEAERNRSSFMVSPQQQRQNLHGNLHGNDDDSAPIELGIVPSPSSSRRSARGGTSSMGAASIASRSASSRSLAYDPRLHYTPNHDGDNDDANASPSVSRRVSAMVRRLSRGRLDATASIMDGDGDDNNRSGSMVHDDDGEDTTNYDDNLYGAVIHDQERIMEHRRSKKNVCLVFLGVGIIAALGLVLYGVSDVGGDGGGDGQQGRDYLGSIGGALGFGNKEKNEAKEQEAQQEAAVVLNSKPTLAPTNLLPEDKDNAANSNLSVPEFDPEGGAEIASAEPVEVGIGLGGVARDKTEAGSKLPPPSSALYSACSPSSVLSPEGRQSCRDHCSPARCCFIEADGLLGPTLSCAATNAEECMSYESACSVLDEDFDEAENSGDEEEEGEEEIVEVLGKPEKEDEGLLYGGIQEPLRLLPIPDGLSKLCSPSSLGLQDSYDKCHDACSQSECCYLPPQHKLSCNKFGNEFTCARYDQICSVLDYYDAESGKGLELSIAIPPPPADLAQTCARDRLDTANGLIGCHQACFTAKCCEIGACTVTNEEVCDDYFGPCNILSGGAGGEGVVASTGKIDDEGTSEFVGEGSADEPPAPAPQIGLGGSDFSATISEEIESLCTQSTLAKPGGITACTIACRPAMCCFFNEEQTQGVKGGQGAQSQMGGSMTGTCLLNKTDEWCANYSPCQVLLHIQDEDVRDGVVTKAEHTAAVDRACSQPDDTGDCANICRTGECCFRDDERAAREECFEQGVDCEIYASCSRVYDLGRRDRLLRRNEVI